MTNAASQSYSADMVQEFEPYTLDLTVQMASGVPSVQANFLGYPVMYATAAVTQATVNAFLGSTNEIDAATAFGSTAMGVDAIAFIINMQGQVKSALVAESMLYDATRIFTAVAGQGTSSTVLPNTLTQGFSVTSLGNIYGRFVITGLDASSSLLRATLQVYMK